MYERGSSLLLHAGCLRTHPRTRPAAVILLAVNSRQTATPEPRSVPAASILGYNNPEGRGALIVAMRRLMGPSC
jgi:hypothetical protein